MAYRANPRIARLIDRAERLRDARSACAHFLRLWLCEQVEARRATSGNDRLGSDPTDPYRALCFRESLRDD